MNTLSRAYTRAFFTTENGYSKLVRRWSGQVRSGAELNAAHHLLYLALRGNDWRHAFGAMTNANRLANGGFEDWGLTRALRLLRARWYEEQLLAPFAGIVTAEGLAKVRELLPRTAHELDEAYRIPETAMSG